MKRGQVLTLSFLLVLALTALYVAVSLLGSSPAPLTTEQTSSLLSVETDTATKICLNTKKESLCLIRQGEFWHLEGVEDFPVDQDIPKNMLAILSPLTPLREVIKAPSDAALYGFDTPVTVTVTDKNGEHSFLLGSECQAVEGYYLRQDEASTVYLVDLAVGIAYCHEDRYDLIQMDPFPKVSEDQITRVTLFTPAGNYTLLKEKSEEADEVWLWEDDRQAADESVVQTLLQTVTSFAFSKCVDHSLENNRQEEIFPEGYGFCIEYLHKSTDEDGKQTQTPVDFTLLIEKESADGEFYRCKLSSSTQLCLAAKDRVEAIWNAIKK